MIRPQASNYDRYMKIYSCQININFLQQFNTHACILFPYLKTKFYRQSIKIICQTVKTKRKVSVTH